jgi:MFS family permease
MSNGTAARPRPGGDRQPLRAFLLSLVVVELFSGVLRVYFVPVYGSLAAKFGVSIGTLSWALTGFTLATAVSTPVFAKLGDVYGHRKILRIEVAIVAVSYLSSVLIFGVLAGSVLTGIIARYGNGPTWALWLPAIGTLAGFAGLTLVLLALSEGSSWGWGSARSWASSAASAGSSSCTAAWRSSSLPTDRVGWRRVHRELDPDDRCGRVARRRDRDR